jgi:hypothetical protein
MHCHNIYLNRNKLYWTGLYTLDEMISETCLELEDFLDGTRYNDSWKIKDVSLSLS